MPFPTPNHALLYWGQSLAKQAHDAALARLQAHQGDTSHAADEAIHAPLVMQGPAWEEAVQGAVDALRAGASAFVVLPAPNPAMAREAMLRPASHRCPPLLARLYEVRAVLPPALTEVWLEQGALDHESTLTFLIDALPDVALQVLERRTPILPYDGHAPLYHIVNAWWQPEALRVRLWEAAQYHPEAPSWQDRLVRSDALHRWVQTAALDESATVDAMSAWVGRMLAAGMDVNQRNERGETALAQHEEVFHENTAPRLALLRHGANPHERASEEQLPILAAAVNHKSMALAQALLEAGADANDCDEHGWTALHYAARHEQPEMVRLLLAHGGDPGRTNAFAMTPMELMLDYEFAHAPHPDDLSDNKRATVELLLAAGAPVENVVVSGSLKAQSLLAHEAAAPGMHQWIHGLLARRQLDQSVDEAPVDRRRPRL